MNWGHPHRGKVLLFAGDTLLAASTILLLLLWNPGATIGRVSHVTTLAVFVMAFLANFYIFDLYNLQAQNGIKTICRLVVACGVATLILSTLLSFVPWFGNHRGSLMSSGPILVAVIYIWRHAYGHITHVFMRREPILVIGSPQDADTVRNAANLINSRYDLVGFLGQEQDLSMPPNNSGPTNCELVESVATFTAARGTSTGPSATAAAPARTLAKPDWETEAALNSTRVRWLGLATPASLREAVAEYAVQSLIVRTDSVAPELASALTRMRFAGIRMFPLPEFYMRLSEELPLEFLSDSWLSFAAGFDVLQARLFRKVKRLTDLFMAATGLLLSLPILLVAGFAIKLESPGSVLLRQPRVGRMGQLFELLKLRSMRADAEGDGKPQWASMGDPRVTRVGRLLRKLRLDEIPQLVNVLHGEMSFVGPRPERPQFVEQLMRSIPFYHLRHYVPPGITGWAQVKYPYGASVEDARRKLQLDLYYICNASPLLDLRILLRTARVILFRQGSR